MTKYGNKIKRILARDAERYTVRLRFEDGFTANVSLNALFRSPKGLVAEILRRDMFSQCLVEGGALAWPNGHELCPDALRAWAEEQRKNLAA